MIGITLGAIEGMGAPVFTASRLGITSRFALCSPSP